MDTNTNKESELESASIGTPSCREVIIQAYEAMNKPLKSADFGTLTFEELNLTVQEFNQLDQQKLEDLYIQLRPLNEMIAKTEKDLNDAIDYTSNHVLAFLYQEDIRVMRQSLAELEVCRIL